MQLINIINFFKIIRLADYPSIKDSFFLKKLILLIKESAKTAIIYCLIKSLKIKQSKDIIYYSYWKNESASALAILKSEKYINNFISRCHGMDLYLHRRKIRYQPFESLIKEHISKVLPISLHGKNYLLKQEYNKNKISMNRLGVKIPNISSKVSNSDSLYLLSCSSIIPLKRVELIAEAINAINFPLYWTHIGDGPDASKLINHINKFSNQTVKLMGGMSNKEVYNFYINNPIDLFVNVSVTEGLPVSVMEALAFGVPCLATNVGGTSELVNNNNGKLLPKNLSAADLQSEIQLVQKNRNIWIDKREIARNTAIEFCDKNKNYLDFLKVLQKI